MSAVASVLVTVVTNAEEGGTSHTLSVTWPGPTGDNPRFMGQQLMTAMTQLAQRHLAVIEAINGKQIGVES